MTSATVIDTRVQRRPLALRPTRPPSLKTFVGQAVAGAVLSHFVLFLVPCFLANLDRESLFLLPCFLFVSLLAGVPAGFIIWACTRSDAPLHWAYRSLIALVVFFPAWPYLSAIVFYSPSLTQLLWLLTWLLVSAVMIGLFTHSRLRLGRELVRGGEAVGRVSRVLAGFSGVVLRLVVVLLFMESLVAVICMAKHSASSNTELLWTTLVCGHLAAGVVVLFLRTDIGLLTVVSAIALVPLIIALMMFPEITETLRYVMIGYFALWAVFLLTRWRQTDFALAFLNDEIHYYLID